MDENEVPEELC